MSGRVVEALFARSLTATEIVARIRRDATLGPGTRELALALVQPYGDSLLTHQAERIVESLYTQAKFRPAVLESLRRDANLSEPVRGALALAEQIPEKPESLNAASRAVVRQPTS